MKKIPKSLLAFAKEKRGLLLLFLVILITGILNSLAAQEAGFFTVYNFAIVMAAYLAGRQRGLTSVSLSIFVVVLFLYYEPQVFRFSGEEWASAFRWASMVAWTGFLLLTTSLLVTLRERKMVLAPASRTFERPLASLPYDLLQTSFTTAEKLVKRLMPRPPAGGRLQSPFGN